MLKDETVEDIDELPLPNRVIFPKVLRRHLIKRLLVLGLLGEFDQFGLELAAPPYQIYDVHRHRHAFTSAAGHLFN
jgi:hypothetical protein